MVNLSPPLRGLRSSMHVPLHLCPLIVDMSSDVMWYSGQSYPVIYWATRGLEKVKRVRCSYVFKQKYSFKGVGMSGKFDQYFPVTDLRKTCCWHNHCEPGHWPLTLFSLKKEMGVIASLLEPNRGRTTCYVNKKSDFRPKDALLFTFYWQSCFIYSLHCSTCDSIDNILHTS